MQATQHLTTPSNDLAAYVAELENRIAELEHHRDFDLPRRPVVERRWASVTPSEAAVIFIDLDGLHNLNKRHGYEGVNARIRAAFGQLHERLRPDTTVAQWYGGDEFVITCPLGNAHGLCARVQALLHQHGLSGSFAIVRGDGRPLEALVMEASERMQAARGGWPFRRRGFIALETGAIIGPPARINLWGAR